MVATAGRLQYARHMDATRHRHKEYGAERKGLCCGLGLGREVALVNGVNAMVIKPADMRAVDGLDKAIGRWR